MQTSPQIIRVVISHLVDLLEQQQVTTIRVDDLRRICDLLESNNERSVENLESGCGL